MGTTPLRVDVDNGSCGAFSVLGTAEMQIVMRVCVTDWMSLCFTCIPSFGLVHQFEPHHNDMPHFLVC